MKLDIPVTIKGGLLHGKESTAAVLDVSALGLCLVTDKELRPGQKISVRVQFPTGQTATVQCEVVWVHERNKVYKIGIRLVDKLQDEAKKFIMYFVSEFITYDFDKDN